MDSKLRKMGILASMAVILLVALAVMYVNREQLSPTSGQNTAVSGAQNAGDGEAVDPVPEGTGETDAVEVQRVCSARQQGRGQIPDVRCAISLLYGNLRHHYPLR